MLLYAILYKSLPLVLAFISYVVLGGHVPCAAFLESNPAKVWMDGYMYFHGFAADTHTSAVVAVGFFLFIASQAL